MTLQLISFLGIAVFAACWLGGIVTWFLAAKAMLKTMNGYRPDKRWGAYLPFSILMPSFFTEEGNRHRAKLLRHTVQFILFLAVGLGVGWGVGAITPL